MYFGEGSFLYRRYSDLMFLTTTFQQMVSWTNLFMTTMMAIHLPPGLFVFTVVSPFIIPFPSFLFINIFHSSHLSSIIFFTSNLFSFSAVFIFVLSFPSFVFLLFHSFVFFIVNPLYSLFACLSIAIFNRFISSPTPRFPICFIFDYFFCSSSFQYTVGSCPPFLLCLNNNVLIFPFWFSQSTFEDFIWAFPTTSSHVFVFDQHKMTWRFFWRFSFGQIRNNLWGSFRVLTVFKIKQNGQGGLWIEIHTPSFRMRSQSVIVESFVSVRPQDVIEWPPLFGYQLFTRSS